MLERTLEYIAAFLRYPFFFLMPIFIMKTISKFLQPKQGKIFTFLRYVICWTAGSMIIFIGDMINILYTLPCFFIIIWISHTSPAAAKLSMSLVFFSLTMSMNALIDSTYITGNYSNLFKFVIWWSIWLICRKFMKSNRYELSVKMWTLIGILALLPFAATVAAVTLTNENWRIAREAMLSVTVLPFAFISSLSLLFTVTVLAKNEKALKENKLYEMRNIYYKNLEQEQLQVRRLRHDMANHMMAIDGLLKEGKFGRAEEYINSLKSSPGMLSMKRWCSNDIINSLLAGKSAVMESSNISYNFKVSLPDNLPIEGLDICSLIGNALDNAIEASLKLNPEDRHISLNLIVQRGMFILNSVNSTPPVQGTKNGRFLTSKSDKSMHGFGLENMRFIADKYCGTMEIQTENNKFDLLVTLPVDD